VIVKRMAVLAATVAAVAGAVLTLPAAANATPYVNNPPQCQGGADYGWFCAYSGQNFTGQSIGMYDCGNYRIPWTSTGSWDNEQTPGTRPWLYWADGSPAWHMPPAPSSQKTNVGWAPVASITNC